MFTCVSVGLSCHSAPATVTALLGQYLDYYLQFLKIKARS